MYTQPFEPSDTQQYAVPASAAWSEPRYVDVPRRMEAARGIRSWDAIRVSMESVIDQWFSVLATQWKAETLGLSSIQQKVAHPAFKKILLLEELALPLILRDLQRGTVHWFPALKIISGEDPVPPNLRGNVAEMKRIWLDWGRGRGHIQ